MTLDDVGIEAEDCWCLALGVGSEGGRAVPCRSRLVEGRLVQLRPLHGHNVDALTVVVERGSGNSLVPEDRDCHCDATYADVRGEAFAYSC